MQLDSPKVVADVGTTVSSFLVALSLRSTVCKGSLFLFSSNGSCCCCGAASGTADGDDAPSAVPIVSAMLVEGEVILNDTDNSGVDSEVTVSFAVGN